MSGKREIKEVLNQNWFKRIRGGEKARETKDAPWLEQDREGKMARSRTDMNKAERKGTDQGHEVVKSSAQGNEDKYVPLDQGHEVVKSSVQGTRPNNNGAVASGLSLRNPQGIAKECCKELPGSRTRRTVMVCYPLPARFWRQVEDPVTTRICQPKKKDRAKQVPTKLVEGQVEKEVAEL